MDEFDIKLVRCDRSPDVPGWRRVEWRAVAILPDGTCETCHAASPQRVLSALIHRLYEKGMQFDD